MCELITNAEIFLSFCSIILLILFSASIMRTTKLERDLGFQIKSNRFLREELNQNRSLLTALRKFNEE